MCQAKYGTDTLNRQGFIDSPGYWTNNYGRFLYYIWFFCKRQTYPRIKRSPSQGAFAHRDGGLLFMRHIAFFRGICGKQAFCPWFVSFTQLRRSLQDPQQVSVRIQAVFLRRFNQAVDHAAGLCAARRIGKQPVLPAHHKGLNAALGTVVAQLQTAILQIP